MSNGEWPTEATGDATADGGGLDFGQALLHRKWMLLFFIALGVGAGWLVHTRTKPIYASNAQLHIAQNQPVVMEGVGGKSGQGNPLETYAVVICSPKLVDDALKHNQDLATLPSMRGKNPRNVILSGLTAEPHETATQILLVSYAGERHTDCQKILGAIINEFMTHLQTTQSNSSLGDIQAITDARTKLESDLAKLEEEYADFRAEGSLVWTQEGGLNIHHQRLADIEKKRAEILIAQSETKSQLESIQDAVARGAKREALLLMVDQLDRTSQNPTITQAGTPPSFISHLLPLMTDRETLVEKVGAKHPDVLALDSKIRATRALLSESAGVSVSGEPLDMVSVYVESLKEKLATQDRSLVSLDLLYQQETDASGLDAKSEFQDRAKREAIDRSKRLLDANVELLERASLAGKVGHVTATLTTLPSSAAQIAPILARSLALGGVAGLLVGILLAFLLEMADQSYRSPDDISRQLGVPVVGHIPNIEIGRERKRLGTTRLHPSLVTYHRPGSQMAEAYRAVRTALLSGTRNQAHQLIQITSPNPGDGKSTLSTNLAMSIAKAGKSVLLVDADLRRPNVHKLLGMENDLGVTSVVEGGMEFDDAIQPGPLPHLDVMTSGPRETNRAELLLSPRFAEMLTVLRERYDYVIVDTPPVLAVSDPAAIGAMVDGVLLVLRINRQTRLHAVRARETLDLVGARLIGVVVNALGDSSAVQGFGTGTRGYRAATYRTLANGYTDNYGGEGGYQSGRYSSYYEESEEPEMQNGHRDYAETGSEFDR